MPTLNFQRGLSNWTAGTASVAAGASVVAFAGTALISPDPANPAVNIYVCGEGDMFIVPGVGSASIKSTDSATQITLDAPWPYAAQTGVAYKIRRYNEVKTGEIGKFIQNATTIGQDGNPYVSLTTDDSVARAKLRTNGGKVQLAVGASAATDAQLLAVMQADPVTGAVAFPNGVALPWSGLKNRLINGAMEVWQRGTNFSIANNAVATTADGWRIANSGTGATATISKIVAPTGFRTRAALNVAVPGAVAGGVIDIVQRVESIVAVDLEGAAMTLSFDLNASTSAGALTGALFVLGATAPDNGGYSTNILGGGTPFAIGAGTTTVKVTVPAANMVGAKNGFQIYIRLTQTGAAGTMNLSLGSVQLEPGAVANPFEIRPAMLDLAMCQRYYERVPCAGLEGAATAAATLLMTLQFAVAKRINPTINLLKTSINATGFYDFLIGGSWPAAATASLTGAVANQRALAATVTGFSGLTAGASVVGNSMTDFFEISAEL